MVRLPIALMAYLHTLAVQHHCSQVEELVIAIEEVLYREERNAKTDCKPAPQERQIPTLSTPARAATLDWTLWRGESGTGLCQVGNVNLA